MSAHSFYRNVETVKVDQSLFNAEEVCISLNTPGNLITTTFWIKKSTARTLRDLLTAALEPAHDSAPVSDRH